MTITCGIQPTFVATMAVTELHNACNMCICILPDMYVCPWACGPWALKAIPRAHVTTIMYLSVWADQSMMMWYNLNLDVSQVASFLSKLL